MLEAISGWLRHMVILVLFAAILDMILPSSTMQKYVRAVLGLVIVLSLLLPIRALFDGVLSGKWEAALSGPLLQASSLGGGAGAGNASYTQSLRSVILQSLELGHPKGSLTVEISSSQMSDGSTAVTGVYIVCQNVSGYQYNRQEAQVLQAQTAELLGLSLAAVHVSYPGGEV